MHSPRKLTPAARAAIVGALRNGKSRKTAAAGAGIHRDTLYEWLRLGRLGEEPYARFVDAVESAEYAWAAEEREHDPELVEECWRASIAGFGAFEDLARDNGIPERTIRRFSASSDSPWGEYVCETTMDELDFYRRQEARRLREAADHEPLAA